MLPNNYMGLLHIRQQAWYLLPFQIIAVTYVLDFRPNMPGTIFPMKFIRIKMHDNSILINNISNLLLTYTNQWYILNIINILIISFYVKSVYYISN